MRASRSAEDVDVLVVGSGPMGSLYARVISERNPDARILMVEAGPSLSAKPGIHMKDVADRVERASYQRRSEAGSAGGAVEPTFEDDQPGGFTDKNGAVRPGTSLLSNTGALTGMMPGAAISTNVGGMGVHWTGACPLPDRGEVPDFVASDPEWPHDLETVFNLLGVAPGTFGIDRRGSRLLDFLQECFPEGRDRRRAPQHMPMAVDTTERPVSWSGTGRILGPLIGSPTERFALRSMEICVGLEWDGSRVVAAWLRDRVTQRSTKVIAKVFVIAADVFRTPQLLWNSGIRPRALGTHLNEHLRAVSAVQLDESFRDPGVRRSDGSDGIIGMYWIPYLAGEREFHGQLTHWVDSDLRQTVGLSWYVPTKTSAANGLSFGPESDRFGMPRIAIEYHLDTDDHARIEEARECQERLVRALGTAVGDEPPSVSPLGSTKHCTGTVRMGNRADGESVCDPLSRVWGFENLYVGGNGVIPTAVAMNSTPLAAGLAVRGARSIDL